MSKKVSKIAVMTSGGDSPGMNAAVRSVVRTCAYHKIDCIGIYRGYEGMMEGDFIPLDARSVRGIINKGGTFLKSARSNRFRTVEGRKIAHQQLVKEGVDALVVIGGDGSFTGALHFNAEFNFPVIGIPGTIDNDISGTDRTLGYDTALNTAVDAPEEDMGIERLVESLERSKKSGKSSSIVVVAEGDKIGKSVFELKDYVDENLEEYDVRVSVLGHMQRGGSPTCYDRVLASRMGVKAVESLLVGKSNYMVGTIHDIMQLTPFEDAIKGETKINKELIRVSEIMTT